MRKKKQKIFVGLSGGVDSSVSAALLKNAAKPKIYKQIFGRPIPKGFKGFNVTGVFIKTWYPDFLPCNWREDRRDAMRVAAKLDIPFITLDLEKEYKKEVVDYMIREYKTGRTPNPDVMCNKEIKFGAFLKWALKNGADYVATGHYARIARAKSRKSKVKNRNSFSTLHFQLYTGRDSAKDQSYFLWTLKQDQLRHILFPVGNLKKSQVRGLAKKFGLPTAEKKDSQGLCFIGKVDFKEFLSHYIKPKKGRVLDVGGRKIGYHNGVTFLTIGQRHGFTILNKGNASKPVYIVAKNVKANTITVSKKNPKVKDIIGANKFSLSNTNWIVEAPEKNRAYQVRSRYRQKLMPAKISKTGNKWSVYLTKPIIDISPGQSLVVYDGEVCMGGGVIN